MASSKLLLQNGDYLLLQNSDKLSLQDDTGAVTTNAPDIRHYPRGETRGVVRGAA